MAGIGIAYPADASSGTPLYTATQGRTAFSAALAGATAARPLGGLSGVRPGTPANTVTTTTTTWTAAAFAGTIDLHTLATNGPYFFSFPAGGSGTVTAAVASARQDIVWVRVDDSNTGDASGARQVVIDYTANTLTPPARAFVIAIINVPATGGGAPSVTWVAPYCVAAGGIQPVPTGVYPTSSYVGQYVDDAVIGLMRFNGTGFVRATPKPPHAEFTTNIGGVPDNSVVNAGTITNDSSMTTDTSFWTIPGAGISLLAGIYAVRWLSTITAPLTGRGFNSISAGSVQQARESAGGAEDTWSVQASDILLTATTVVNFSLFKVTGGSVNATGRIFITKIG